MGVFQGTNLQGENRGFCRPRTNPREGGELTGGDCGRKKMTQKILQIILRGRACLEEMKLVRKESLD